MNRTEPIRDVDKLNDLLSYYKKKQEYRNHVLVNLGVFTALRISDILKLNTNDVYDFKRKSVRETISIKEKKTGKSKYHLWKKGRPRWCSWLFIVMVRMMSPRGIWE